jgi:hypothetical protein
LPVPVAFEVDALSCQRLLEELVDARLHHAFSLEPHVACIGDHGTDLDPDHAVQVDLEQPVVLQLEHAFALVLLGCLLYEFLQ